LLCSPSTSNQILSCPLVAKDIHQKLHFLRRESNPRPFRWLCECAKGLATLSHTLLTAARNIYPTHCASRSVHSATLSPNAARRRPLSRLCLCPDTSFLLLPLLTWPGQQDHREIACSELHSETNSTRTGNPGTHKELDKRGLWCCMGGDSQTHLMNTHVLVKEYVRFKLCIKFMTPSTVPKPNYPSELLTQEFEWSIPGYFTFILMMEWCLWNISTRGSLDCILMEQRNLGHSGLGRLALVRRKEFSNKLLF
jgi:hypothetical protein